MRAGLGVLVLALGACGAQERPVFELSAELVSPTDTRLSWRGGPTDAAATVVEFATEPSGQYTILEFLPPDRTSFEHPDLMPETTFYYRVRPVRGPASEPVDVRMDAAPGAPPPPDDWAAPRTETDARARPSGLGAPANLTATVVAREGVRFEWTDNAATEAGFLLESRPAGEREFRVVAVLEREVNAVGLVTLPTERAASYRVRAYQFGEPSTVARRTTGIS